MGDFRRGRGRCEPKLEEGSVEIEECEEEDKRRRSKEGERDEYA